jgi:sialidase-1
MSRYHSLSATLCLVVAFDVFMVSPRGSAAAPAGEPVTRPLAIEPGPGNPRNSEGAFVQLKDGRVLFVYTHFTGGGGDHSAAYLAGRYSTDGGKTWTDQDAPMLANEGHMNVMSVSLLRLADGRIALFYLRKNSATDCRPCMRVSADEGQTWSAPTICVPDDQIGYYVLNNDRAIQLKSGRLILPVALHHKPGWAKPDWDGTILCYLSDDAGRTWRASNDSHQGKKPEGKRITLQEPGVVELKDGRLMMFSRTRSGCQYVNYSRDGGDIWSVPQVSNILSPCSPATIKRIPATGDLLLAWNNHAAISRELRDKRTPLTVAISKDDGRTWENVKTLEDDPAGWYCYIAMEFVGDSVLLGHCAGNLEHGHLSRTQITRFPVDWLYK